MIELTFSQAEAIAAQSGPVVVLDPLTKQVYRLVREDLFKKVEVVLYDDSPWTGHEMALLAGEAFSKLDDDDYSHYLSENQ